MITLFVFTGFIVSCCVATAGLIASAQNSADANKSMLSETFDADIGV